MNPTDSAPDAPLGPPAEKTALRRRMRDRLAAIDADERATASTAACRRLIGLEAFRRASTVMLYLPLPSEIDVLPAAVDLFRRGRTVCVPRVDWDRRDMAPVAVSSFDNAGPSPDGHPVRTPEDGRPVLPERIDAVVVPAMAFDTDGNRLGRGGGYYDRFLGRLRRGTAILGIAFDQQIVDAIPSEPHDVSVGCVITDRRITAARASDSRP